MFDSTLRRIQVLNLQILAKTVFSGNQKKKNNSKFNLVGYLEGESSSLLEWIQKVVYPPVFLGEKSIKVTKF